MKWLFRRGNHLYNAYPTHEKHVPTISTDFSRKLILKKAYLTKE